MKPWWPLSLFWTMCIFHTPNHSDHNDVGSTNREDDCDTAKVESERGALLVFSFIKGPNIKDVHKIFGFWTPSPPCPHFG